MPNFDRYIDLHNKERTDFIAAHLPTAVRLPDGTSARINGMDADTAARSFVELAREFVGDDYAAALEAFLDGCIYDSGIDIDRDYDSEMAAEEYREALLEIENLCDTYKTQVFDKKKNIMRKDLDSFISAVRSTARSY